MPTMRFRLRAVLATAVLLASAAARAAEDAPPDPLPVPPGTPADQQLWRTAGDVGREITVQRTEASGLGWKANKLDLAGRLEAAAKGAASDEATRLAALRQELVAAQVESYEILTGRWPVDPTRGCQYPQLLLGSAMQSGDGPSARSILDQARRDAQECVDAARLILARLGASNRRFSSAVDAAVKALPWPAAPGAATGAPASASDR